MSVRDGRKGFHWLTFDEVEHIRVEWKVKAPSAATGLGVFRALAELANEHKSRTNIAGGSDQFRTSQKEIGERAMVSARSVGRACEELERIGMLVIEYDRDGANRQGRPNFYTLLDPPATYDRKSDGSVTQRKTGCQTPSDSVSDVRPKGATGVRTSLYKGKKEEKKEEGARVVETREAIAAWESAKALLFKQLSPAKFDQVRELTAAGECGGTLVLVDRSDRGANDWHDRAAPVILETVDGYDALEILDDHELEQSDVLSEFDVWLEHYHRVTGRTAMTGSKEARKLFTGRRREDPPRTLSDLMLATVGAHGNDHLRREALDKPETILRESNVGRYIELGRSAGRSHGAGGDDALAAITGRAA